MIFIKPFVTEKSSQGEKNNCYTLSIDVNCNKIQIKKEFKNKIGLYVKNIITMLYPRKDKSKYTKKKCLYGKTNIIKKAVYNLKKIKKNYFFNTNKKEV